MMRKNNEFFKRTLGDNIWNVYVVAWKLINVHKIKTKKIVSNQRSR